jgi:hypothetical protein
MAGTVEIYYVGLGPKIAIPLRVVLRGIVKTGFDGCFFYIIAIKCMVDDVNQCITSVSCWYMANARLL